MKTETGKAVFLFSHQYFKIFLNICPVKITAVLYALLAFTTVCSFIQQKINANIKLCF